MYMVIRHSKVTKLQSVLRQQWGAGSNGLLHELHSPKALALSLLISDSTKNVDLLIVFVLPFQDCCSMFTELYLFEKDITL